MDMDMDIGWCLTCAKRTRDQKSPYCSEACRQADTHPSTPVTEPLVITSPLPPKLVPLPPTSPIDRRPSCRSAKTPEANSNGMVSPPSHPRQRDRRAFSFNASEEEDRPSLPSFNRKQKGVNATLFKKGYVSRMSTGTSTPNDSAVYSTSESEREDAMRSPRRPPLSPLASVSILHPQPPLPMSRINNALAISQATSHSSQLHTPRQSLEARTASSPFTRMASSSSRSREDIISWARGVDDAAPEGSTIRHPRGRGRRPEALANLTPPSTEPLDEPQGHTPRSAGALSALNMTFAPVVSALRNVSLVSTPEAPSMLGLQTCAAPTTVSRIDVVVGTRNDDMMFNDGCTPTLSTVSLSEAVDTSNATDLGETIETATDGFSVSSSHYRTPPPPTAMRPAESSRRSTGLRPPSLQQTASAIWNFSSFIRSFTPFSTPFALVSSPSPLKADIGLPLESGACNVVLTPALGLDVGTPATAAVPAAPRSDVTEEFSEQQLVRSVPLDIVIAAGSKAQAIGEERAREREVIEYLGPRSCSGTRNGAQKPGLVDEPAFDGSRSDEDERGRGRRRGRGRNEDRSAEREEPETEATDEQRGRRRDRGGESRDRSWSAVRGRTSRTRATVRA